MSLSEEDARHEVEAMSLQRKSAARDSVTDLVWQGLSWNERLAVAQRVEEPPLLPFQTPRNEARIITASDIGYSTPKDEQLYTDAVAELFETCVNLQGDAPPGLPDNHLPGRGRQPDGVTLDTFIRVAGLAFLGMRTEQVEVIWDEVMNKRGRFDPYTQKATQADLKALLDTASLHNVMSPNELLRTIPFVTMELRKELTRNPEPPLLDQRERIEQAEASRDTILKELQALDVYNANLEREVLMDNGSLPYAPLVDLVKEFCDSHQPFNVKEFTCLIDMTVPSMRHIQAISLWRSLAANTESSSEVTPEQVTELLAKAAAAHMISDSELAKRLTAANNLGVVTPVRDNPWDTPPSERTSFDTILARVEKERGHYEKALDKAKAKNVLLVAEVQRLQAVRNAQEAEKLARLAKPEYPPPEVPEELWVVVTGGWEEVARDGSVRPGVYGPKGKTDGRYVLVGGVEDPRWERVREPKAAIYSHEGVWVVGTDGGPIITSRKPHDGWRPHEVDAGWSVCGDISNTWHVHVTAMEQRDEGMATGLCSICKTRVQAQRLGLYDLEMEGERVRGEVEVLAGRKVVLAADMGNMLKTIEVYQDNTEAPAVPRSMKWGTGGEYEHTVAPKWTGGRPPAATPAYHRLPAPRTREPLPSRQSAVYSQLAHLRESAPPSTALRRPTPAPTLYPARAQPPHDVLF